VVLSLIDGSIDARVNQSNAWQKRENQLEKEAGLI